MGPVGGIKRAVRHVLGFLVVSEQDFKDVGPRDFPGFSDLGMQLPVLAHILDQLGIFEGPTLLDRNHSFIQPQIPQLGQDFIDRVVHRVVRVHQRGVPVEQDDSGNRVRKVK